MDINTALQEFYNKHGFGTEPGKRPPRTIKVYTGCMLVPLPNIETRRKYLKYHDLHHIITGFSVGRIGEGKVSSWELGTGTFFQHPILAFMNLIALSTGLLLKPKDMWKCFLAGKRSNNLYSKTSRQLVDTQPLTLNNLRERFFDLREHMPTWATRLEFTAYCCMAMAIHGLIFLPALAVRLSSDLIHKGTIVPEIRTDLY